MNRFLSARIYFGLSVLAFWLCLMLPQLASSDSSDKPNREEEQIEPPRKGITVRLAKDVTLRLVPIPRGKYLMGSPKDEEDRDESERQRQVTISKPFYMGAHEVTQKQFATLMGYNPSYFSRNGQGLNNAKYDATMQPAGGKNKVPANTDHFPVENITWKEAVDFCAKLSALPAEKQAKRKYRLPSDAEWEYACRAGSKTAFCWGNSLSSIQANFDGRSPAGNAPVGVSLDRTCKVGSYRPNAWGLYDMHGNVEEYCQDWYAVGHSRVVRGGSWLYEATACRSASRFEGGGRSYDAGFRVVFTVE